MVKKALDKMSEIIFSDLLSNLKECSIDTKKHALMNDTMIANLAILIEKSAKKDFEIKIDEMNSKYFEKLNFRCIGPLPPYSFYTLEVKKMQHKDFDWAKKELGLEKYLVSKDEIRKAYQRKAFTCHPDIITENQNTDKEFGEVNKAYKILNEYQSCEQANHRENKFVDMEDFDQSAMLVKVKD